MLRFERFNTFYIFNLHLDARWGRHNSQRYGGIFSMYRNHWSNTLSTNAFDQYDKSTLQRSQNLDIRSYSNVQNSVRALYNHTMGRGDILTVGGDMMRDYLMNDKLTEGAQDYLINGAHLEDYSRAELKAIRGSILY